MVVELGVVVVDWLGVVVVDCDGVTPVAEGVPGVAEGLVCVADGTPCVAEGLVCVADGLPTVPAPPGAVAAVPEVPVVPGAPVVCAAATPIARISTNDAHMVFFIRCRSFAASSAEFPVIAKATCEWDAMPVRLGWHRLARTGSYPYNVRRLTLQVADDW